MKEKIRFAARSYAWLLALCAAQMSVLVVFMNFAGAQPLIQSDWDLSHARAGAIQAARQFGYVLAVLVLSSLTDYVRAERIIVVSALWAAASNLAFSRWAHDAASGMALQALTGAGVAGVYMPGVKLISQRVPALQRGRAIGLFVGSFTLGAAASIAFGGVLARALGWRAAFALTAVGPAIGAWIAWRGLPTAEGKPLPSAPPTPDPDKRPIVLVRHNRPALFTIAAYTAHAWEVLGLRSWLPAFLAAALIRTGAGLEEATRSGAAVAGVATLLGAVGVASVATLSDRLGRTQTIMVVTSLSSLCIIGLGFSLTLPWALVVALSLVAALLANADSAVISTTLTEIIPTEILGRVLGVYSFLGFTARAIAPLVFGATLDVFEPSTSDTAQIEALGWKVAFATLALGSLVTLVMAAALHRERKVDG